jgi:hypothetical protein
MFRLRDGTIVEREITAVAGTYPADTAVAFAGGAVEYVRGCPVALGIEGREIKDAIITSLSLTPELEREVTVIEWVTAVFADEATIVASMASDATQEDAADQPSAIPLASSVSDVEATQVVNVAADGTGGEGLVVSFDRALDRQAGHTRVFYRRSGSPPEPWRLAGSTLEDSFRVVEANEPGVTYDVSVVPLSADGAHPDPSVQAVATGVVYERGSRFPGAVSRVRSAVR